LTNLFGELKRRNIFRVAGAYAVIGWLLAQMGSVLESMMSIPSWFNTNALTDRKSTALLFFDSIFEPLEQLTGYQAFRARMLGLVLRDRARVQAQHDNPSAIWWSPDDLPEGNK